MGTNQITPGTKSVGIRVEKEIYEELENRAALMNFSLARYCKIILSQWLKSDKKLTLNEK